MCTPAKRLATEVLDLSRKSVSPGSFENTNLSDIAILSEDDDKNRPISCDTEKENTPLIDEANNKLLLRRLENELKQEENALLLLHRLRENQKNNLFSSSSISTPKSTTFVTSVVTTVRPNSPQVTSLHNDTSIYTTSVSNSTRINNAQLNVVNPICTSTPKLTKSIALQSLEQHYNSKKLVLRKQLERNLENIYLPKPIVGTGLCEVAFVPSTLTAEFTALLGLEEVVKTIQECWVIPLKQHTFCRLGSFQLDKASSDPRLQSQSYTNAWILDFDPSGPGKLMEAKRVFCPFSCVRCKTDFTPVWKRERPGSSDVICEACLGDGQRSILQKDFDTAVKQTFQQHMASEQDIECEYHDIMNTPVKLEAYIHEQEKKLLATHQAQLTQQQIAAQLHTQRYHNKQPSIGSSGNGIRPQQSSSLSAQNTNTVHQRQRQSPSTTVTNPAASSAVTPQAAVLQQRLATASQQLASQYQQQLDKANVSISGGNSSSVTAAALMMAAAATSTQQQQQRLAAAIAGIQQQQTQNPHQQATLEQIAQLQAALFMNTLLYTNAAGSQASAANPQQLLQHALQYSYLLQQQQQQAVAAQQVHQHAAAAAVQMQQASVLSQLMGARGTNPAACLSLLQNLWAFNSAKK